MDKDTPLIDPRIIYFIGDEEVEFLQSLNYDTVANLWFGLHVYPESFQAYFGDKFSAINDRLSQLMPGHAMFALEQQKEQLLIALHDPLWHQKYAELYAIPGVLQVRAVPQDDPEYEGWNLIAEIDARLFKTIRPQIESYEQSRGELVFLEPICPQVS